MVSEILFDIIVLTFTEDNRQNGFSSTFDKFSLVCDASGVNLYLSRDADVPRRTLLSGVNLIRRFPSSLSLWTI